MLKLSGLPCAAISLALLAAPAQAAPPNAGATLQNIESTKPEPPKAPAPVLDVQPAKPLAASASAHVKIPVSEVRITGTTRFTPDELAPVVADSVGKELTLPELDEVAARITRFYRDQGYFLAAAYIPAQDIKNGVVEIAVLEGKYGAVNINNPQLVSATPLTVAAGDLVALPSLERGLLLLNDLPGIRAQSTLRPGASLGTSDLLVEVTEGKAYTGSIELDNYGSRYTGADRFGGTLNINNPSGLGDVISLRGMTGGSGMNYGRISYQAPVNRQGTKAGVAYSDMEYELGKDFSELDAHGDAQIITAFATHPFIRSRALNLNGQISYDDKDLKDRIDSTDIVTDKTLKVWSIGLSGDNRDSWGGGGTNVIQATATLGELTIESPLAKSVDDLTVQTNGYYNKLNLTLMRLQRLTDRTSVYLSYSQQWASQNLDSSEKFIAGGAFGVRAYPSGEAPGDEGHLVTAELRYELPAGFQCVGFIDSARVSVNKDPWALATGGNTRELAGVGVGMNWSDARGFAIRSYYAHKTSATKATAESDKDGRFWLQAAYSF